MKEDIYRSQFRLPHSLYEQLKASAEAKGISLNSELVARLERSFVEEGRGSTIEEIKSLLIERDRKLFEDAVNSTFQRYLDEIKKASGKQ